jgi:hypothetical protein
MTISISVHTGIFKQERLQWTSVTPPPSNSDPADHHSNIEIPYNWTKVFGSRRDERG